MREQRDSRTNANLLGPLSNRRGDYLGCRTDIAAKVVLADPDGIEAKFFGVARFIEEFL